MVPSSAYVVCATPRSGSTLLCELLKSTGIAGRPEEYFEARAQTGLPPHPGEYLDGLPRTGAGIRDDATPPSAPEYSSLVGLTSYREHLERTFALGTTDNGVFATKLMWRNVADLHALASSLPEYRGLTVHRLLERLLGDPRYVWVTRREKARQAVSLWRSLQTRSWRLEHPDQAPSADSLRYSFDGIDHLVRSLQAEDERWRVFFAQHRLAALQVVYEDDLERDQDGTIERVLEHVGVAFPADWTRTVRMYRQADALTERWVDAYERDRTADAAGARLTAGRR
jgi:LPS sulfotransferase NodH